MKQAAILLAAGCIVTTVGAQTPALAPTPPHGHSAAAPSADPGPGPTALLSGLGSHRHPIQTSNAEAQKYFNQGVTLLFGFNHEEAYRSFAKAAELDPKSPMPHWGMALSLGANYNDPEPEADRLKKARTEVEKALGLSTHAAENERAYVEALSVRYVADPASADKAQLAGNYAAAMKALSARYPDDLDAATMYAESLMNLHPWKLWKPDGTPGQDTLEIVAVLEAVLKRDPNHPGANHFYIHAVEASRDPQRALASAARLETLVPSAGHLVHMPSHIYMRTGSYAAAEKANAIAADVDRAYIRQTGAQGMYPAMYYTHNVHFESAAACMAGRSAAAKKAADVLFADALPGVAEMPMLEGFLLQPTFVALRFRNWDEIRKMPDPGPKLPLARAVWFYAGAVAAAARGEGQRAEMLREGYAITRDAVPAATLAGPQNSAIALFAVATPALDARIFEAKGMRKQAIESWKRAVEAQDALAYDEPEAWYYPTRESLGAALLADGQPAEAEAVFRADLESHPRNGRALFGLVASLEAQKKTADAAWTRAQFEAAWKDADISLKIGDL
jgi:tetratricopeptide (TPR) repeat protein